MRSYDAQKRAEIDPIQIDRVSHEDAGERRRSGAGSSPACLEGRGERKGSPGTGTTPVRRGNVRARLRADTFPSTGGDSREESALATSRDQSQESKVSRERFIILYAARQS